MTKKFLSKILNEFRTKDFLENSQYYNELSPRMKKVVGSILTNIDEKDLIKDLDNKIKESVIKYKISEKDLQNYIDKEINLELQREN
jgi:Mg/Co/Ni transporter MgtE